MKSTETKTVRGPRDFQSRIKKIALIGCGKLGEGLLSGMLGSQLIPVESVEATVAHQPRADFLAEKYGVKAHTNNIQAVKGADLVLIVLKPQQVKGFLHEVKKVSAQGRGDHFRRGVGHHGADRARTGAPGARHSRHAQHALPDSPGHDGALPPAPTPRPTTWRWRGKSSAPWAAPWWWTRSTWTPSPAFPPPARPMFT